MSYHRKESPSQTKQDALRQVASLEIWGRAPRGGCAPTVQAYAGLIKAGERGIGFTTNVPPHPNGSPFEARWYYGRTPGVEIRQINNEDFACIPAVTVNNHQP